MRHLAGQSSVLAVGNLADVGLGDAKALSELHLREAGQFHRLRHAISAGRLGAPQFPQLLSCKHGESMGQMEYSSQELLTPESNIPLSALNCGVYRNIPSRYALAVALHTNIRRLRRAVDITQTELGNRLGVGQGAVAKWEKGSTEPAASMLPALAVALRARLDELLRDVDEDYDATGSLRPIPAPVTSRQAETERLARKIGARVMALPKGPREAVLMSLAAYENQVARLTDSVRESEGDTPAVRQVEGRAAKRAR